ncbi:Mitochondrial import inner membrane translocase subunit TIM44 [Morus notabilis]|uniref:Mitochondrial import inner membrane translocase subunit TIM44 n=1 Tax=Morus notabilis TaxID=981085 RepID=W9RRU8_9ROSA|nr:mitochondrial import inner membrane translocase subunit TIM44-2 isoform X2 [Morus notabilis]EXC05426.1 Mitochondrial import inner membrane translocase subunit TIM44 [Morus notabilis]
MAGRKLVRDYLLSKSRLFLQLTHSQPQASSSRLLLPPANGFSGNRRFSVFNEFSKQVKGEANKNSEFQQSVKELKDKARELKGVKEDLKVRTKQTTEQLYKQVDGAWTEAEAKAKMVSANLKEKISAATEDVKGTLGIGKEEAAGTSAKTGENVKDGSKASDGEQATKQSDSDDTAETLFGKYKSRISTSNASSAFQRFKEAKFIDLAKKGYDIVKDELSSNPKKRKHLQHDPSSSKVERSTRTEVVFVPSKQSPLNKKWEAFKNKVLSHPIFKRINVVTDPVVTKGQEIAEDVRERWETSDSPIVHKIQDINETIFQETDAAATIKEIRYRDPSFSLPEFVAEVQEAIKPVLKAYTEGDVETLKKFCTNEVIERCKAEHSAYQSHGIFFDNKILHISEVEVRETKMMGTSPVIIVAFQTQQVYCVRDRNGAITEGGQDTIHTVYYAWAMQQIDPEELGEGAIYPIWKLREMQQLGVQTLI